MKPLVLAGLIPLLIPVHAAILFEDTFDRPDSRNIQAALDGITDNTGSALAAGTVYSQPQLDPNNASPAFGAQDGNAANGGGAQILSNALQVAVGAGTSNAFVNHNFINADIVTAGGFSVTLDVNGYGQSTSQQGGGFAIGMSQAEAASAKDAIDLTTPKMTGAFAGTIGNPVPANVVADFWVAVRGNNTLVWGGRDGNVLGATGLPTKTGTIAANFRFSDFNAATTVTYEVIHDGVLRGTGTFAWSKTDSNHIGIDGRDSGSVTVDNLAVATDFLEPFVFEPFVDSFEATRLPGTNDTRFHWKVIPGTIGDPVTVTITSGGSTLHTTNDLSGFADIDASGATDFSLTAGNAAGEDFLDATVAAENDFSAAVRADAPVAWYRFNQAFNATVVADCADNPAPHDGNVIGSVTTGLDGPLDGSASFPGVAASILTDTILDPSTPTAGFTIEAVARRLDGGQQNAAIVSQIDGTGIGRSILSVNNDGTIQTFLAGGPAQRKDADVKLAGGTWAHLAIVVDLVTPEMRFYLDGALVGSTADGMNPDGSTFDPNFLVESATGAWRIGTQKDNAQNFWLGDMDELAIYDTLLDDPNGDANLADSRVEAHYDAWIGSASGLLGFFAASETIPAGGATTLTVKVGADVTSVSVDQGIGTLTPVDGVVTIPVNPSATTIYTLTVNSGTFGTQFQTVTVTVEDAEPPVITAAAIIGSDFSLTFSGAPSTTYNVRGSVDLLSFPIDLGTATTDGAGLGTALIPIAPGDANRFYRIEETP